MNALLRITKTKKKPKKKLKEIIKIALKKQNELRKVVMK